MAATEEHHWWFVGRRSILSSFINRLNLPDNSNVLEIGAGTGGNLRMLASFGNIYAIESNELARDMATSRTGMQVLPGALPYDIPVATHAFDMVCLFDVLEHIKDDVAALVRVRDLLRPGGYVLLTVPALPWLWGPHDVALSHHRRYSRRMLDDLVGMASMRVQRQTYFNTLLSPLAIVSRFADSLFRRSTASGLALPHPMLNDLLSSIFSFEATLLRNTNFPFGISLLAVLRLD